MKKLMSILLLWLLLFGSIRAAASPQFRLSPTKETENDNLRCYPLSAANCRFFTYGNDLLLLHPDNSSAQLLRFRGKALSLAAQREVPASAVLLPGKDAVCCYEAETGTALVFSGELERMGTYLLPDCQGVPCISGNGTTLYYCTQTGLKQLFTDTGIHRLLRQQESLTLQGLLENQGLLLCGSGLYSLEDGSLVYDPGEVAGLAEWGSRSLLALHCGDWDCLYMGKTMLPLPQGWRYLTFLPSKNAVLTRREDGSLAIYDLSTGKLLAELDFLPEAQLQQAQATEDGRIFFASGGCLWQWEPKWTSKPDSRIHISTLCSREAPDEKALNQCRQRGAYLENQFGMELLLNEEALCAVPVGIQVEPEYVSAPILETLSGIEAALGKFPKQLLQGAFSGCGRICVCPVRRIEAGGTERLGLQFWSGMDCYLLITASSHIRRGVLQALMPLVERQLVMKSDCLDDWNRLNPPDFVYGGETEEELAFADAESMKSPEADREGLLYAAMEDGNRELFLSVRLQNKLRTLSRGLRQVFQLDGESKLLWEQYLWRQ